MLGDYTGMGAAVIDMFTSATTANFSSDVPFVFVSNATGDQLVVDYAGTVALTDVGGGLFDTTWVADFTPVIGQSTGVFADVIGGSFTVTAETDNFMMGQVPVNYTWGGSGTLQFIPEPSSAIFLLAGGLMIVNCRRRK